MSIGRSAEQQYHHACEHSNWEMLLTLISDDHGSFERNLIIESKKGERRTLAAELILLGQFDLLTKLCQSPYFTLNRLGSDQSPVFTALHAAASIQNKFFLEKCLAQLSSDIFENKEAYLNMTVKHASYQSVSAFALSFLASKDDNQLNDLLLAAGASPFCLVREQSRSQHSLFYHSRFDPAKFEYYCNVVKREPVKLKEFLTKAFDYQCDDGTVVKMNVMEESLLIIVEAEHQAQTETEQEELDVNLRSVMSITRVTIADHNEKVSSIRMVQDLYRTYCFDPLFTTEAMTVAQLRKRCRAISTKVANEQRDYEKVFGLCQNALMSVSLSKAQIPYLSTIDDGDTGMFTNTIGFAVNQSPYYSLAERCDDSLPTYPMKAKYAAEMRQMMQVYYGPMKGHTPITYAVISGKIKFIEACVKAGHLELNSPVIFGPQRGITPLGLALLGGHQAIARTLLHYFIKIKNEPSVFFDKPQPGVMFNMTIVEWVNEYGDQACKKLLGELQVFDKVEKLVAACTSAVKQYSRLVEGINSNIDKVQMLVDRGKKIKANEPCEELLFDRTYEEMSKEEKAVLDYLLAFPVPKKLPEIKMDVNGPSSDFLRIVTKAIAEAKDFDAVISIHLGDVARRYNKLIDIMDDNVKEQRSAPKNISSPVQIPLHKNTALKKRTHKPRLRASLPDGQTFSMALLVVDRKASPHEDLGKANHTIKVYNSYLSITQQNAKSKIDAVKMDNVYLYDALRAHSELKRILDKLMAIRRVDELTELADDAKIKSSMSECEMATQQVKSLDVSFHVQYKTLDRSLRSLNRSGMMTYSSEEFYEDEFDNSSTSASSTSSSLSRSSGMSVSSSEVNDTSLLKSDSYSSSPVKSKSPLPYDIYSEEYTIHVRDDGSDTPMQPRRKPRSKQRRQRSSKKEVYSLGEVQAMFSHSSSPVATDNKLPIGLFKSCADKILRLKRLHRDYQSYCNANSLSGLDDLACAKWLSAIEGDLLALYETLRIIHRDHPRYSIFSSRAVAENLRNMMKYSYVYIFSHEGHYLRMLINMTFDLTANAVTNRIRQAPISVITSDHIPRELSDLLHSKTAENIETLNARLDNMNGILSGLTQQISKVSASEEGASIQDDSAHAQLFCLAIIGQVNKEIAELTSILGLGNYSQRLTSRVLSHPIGDEFAQDLKIVTTTPLLNHFAAVAKSAEGNKYVTSLIADMTKNDVLRLLKEILDAKSHHVEGVWVSLSNPYLIRIIHQIAIRYIEVTQDQELLSSPVNIYHNEIDYVLSSFEMWAMHPVLREAAVKHPFFIQMENALSDLANGKSEQAYAKAIPLFEKLGPKSRFELFAAHFLKSDSEKKTLISAEQILMQLVHSMQPSGIQAPRMF